jgi:septum formation inhibitor-activating ATPase MinD
MVELRPRAGLADQRAVGAGDGEVLHHALDVVVGAVGDGEVPGHRDADRAVGVIGDQRRVLESEDLPARRPAVARPVVHVDQFGAGLPVEDLEPAVVATITSW